MDFGLDDPEVTLASMCRKTYSGTEQSLHIGWKAHKHKYLPLKLSSVVGSSVTITKIKVS